MAGDENTELTFSLPNREGAPIESPASASNNYLPITMMSIITFARLRIIRRAPSIMRE